MQTCPRYHQQSLDAEKRIRAAFEFRNDMASYLIYDVNYWLFGALPESIPADYCDADPTSLIACQSAKIDRHMQHYDDCYIPFLMPWYGTGVLASGFGVPVIFAERVDPAVDLPVIERVEQLDELRPPNAERDGLMPRVLQTIRTMRATTDLPVGVTDCQGPLTTALQIIGYDKMCYWMHDHPAAIHRLMQMVTDALVDWVRVQKQVAGQEPCDDAYVLGTKIPSGLGGVWISDDDSTLLGANLYREFVVPYNSQVLEAFGGGAIHYCGTANQHIDNFLATRGLRAIQNFNLDNLDAAARVRLALAERGIAYIAGDFNVADNEIDAYYEALFRKFGTRGLIVAAYIAPACTLSQGKYAEARRDPEVTGRAIDATIRKYNRPQSAARCGDG